MEAVSNAAPLGREFGSKLRKRARALSIFFSLDIDKLLAATKRVGMGRSHQMRVAPASLGDHVERLSNVLVLTRALRARLDLRGVKTR